MEQINPVGTRSAKMPGLIAAFLCAGIFAIPGKAFAEIPRGVFCLLRAGGGTGQDAMVFDDPDVDGISVRQNWSDLEPAENVYNWAFLDTVVARAAAAGKPVVLRIGTQESKPAWVTTAATNAGGTFFTFTQNGVQAAIPAFWDPTYLAKKKAMIRALGAHFTNNPTVRIVSASFANSQSEDWAVQHTTTDVTNWLAAGYTSAKMLDAGKQIIDTTMEAFPNQYVTLAVGTNGHVASGPNLDPDANYLARNAILNARASWPGRLIVQKNSLTPAAASYFQLLGDSRPDVAAQMLWWCYGDTTYRMNGGGPADPSTVLRESVDVGVAHGVKYIEIYSTDIVNLPAVTHYAHNALRATTAPRPPTDLQVAP